MTRNTFYLDMDGVCADWDRAAEQFLGIPTRLNPINGNYTVTPDEWERLRSAGHFYRHLPVMPGADILVDLARQYRDTLGWDLFFLTAIPHKNDVPDAFSDKVLWALEHFPDIEVHFGPYAVDKHRHCRPGDILVDDRLSNCESWRAAGGKAVKVSGRTLTEAIELVREDLVRRVELKNLRDISLDLI
jgi:5'(3')-deoxyribonucleotidase